MKTKVFFFYLLENVSKDLRYSVSFKQIEIYNTINASNCRNNQLTICKLKNKTNCFSWMLGIMRLRQPLAKIVANLPDFDALLSILFPTHSSYSCLSELSQIF